MRITERQRADRLVRLAEAGRHHQEDFTSEQREAKRSEREADRHVRQDFAPYDLLKIRILGVDREHVGTEGEREAGHEKKRAPPRCGSQRHTARPPRGR